MRIYSRILVKIIFPILGVMVYTGVKATDTTLIDVITLPYNIKTIASDSTGTVWASGARGLQYYDFEKETFVTADPSFKDEIIASEGKITKFNNKKGQLYYNWLKCPEWLSWIPAEYSRITVAKDKFGHYWVSTGSQLFIFAVEDRFKQIFSGYSTRGIYQDGTDLYVHSYTQGILKNGRPLFKKPVFAEGEIKKIGESLYFAWGGLIRYQPKTQTYDYLNFEHSENLLKNPRPTRVYSLDQIRDTIWVGTSFGLGYIEKDSVVMVSNYPYIQDLLPYKDGLLIAGRSLYNPRVNKLLRPLQNLPKPDCEDCRGVYIWKNNQLNKLDDLPEVNYNQILEAEGRYYFASDIGVVVWDGAKVTSVITEYDGLTDNRVCSIVMDDDGILWASTFSGLNRINLKTRKINRYLENIEFNYRSVFQNESLIYMGSMHGIYQFNPKDFLGDDIEPAPSWTIKQTLLLLGLSMPLLILATFFLSKRYIYVKHQVKETQLKETKIKLFLLQIDQIVFSTNLPITVSSLANALDISERTLYRNFKEYGLTPGAYLKELKVKKARHLLKSTNCREPLKDVAQQVGYTEAYLKKILKKEDYEVEQN